MSICLKFIVFLSPLFILSSCLSSLTLNETGRTVGKGNHEISIATGVPYVYAIKWNYGLTENFDFGLKLESLTQSLRLKYALIQGNSVGSGALAIAGGAGIGDGGKAQHYYGDVIGSVLGDSWEPYVAARAGYVHAESTFQDSDSIHTFIFSSLNDILTGRTSYGYGQAFLGTRLWISKTTFLSLEGSYLFPIVEGKIQNEGGYTAGIALGFRF
ncbi:hypothetical protein [Fluviispira vulneris]|uniref:hypothetical protein n=1 Tax=Fluviispira vulneris TaxID=2763012 RepID=UPI001647BD88|nr:hypothetical protein [Fluviispira vulneris]